MKMITLYNKGLLVNISNALTNEQYIFLSIYSFVNIS